MPKLVEIEQEFRKACTVYKNEGGTYDSALDVLDEVFADILEQGMASDAASVLRAHQMKNSPSAEVIERAKAKLAEAEAKAAKPISMEIKKARALGNKVVAAAVADAMSITCPGYGPWGSIAVGQLPTIAAELTRHGTIAKVLMRSIPVGTSTAKSVRDVVTMATFERAKELAAAVLNGEMGIEEREDRDSVAVQ